MARYVLTMQSHVAYGFVGNTAAVFPLQLMGFTPIVVNTVQFSNHTGHPTFRGAVFSKEHLLDVIQGLRERELFPKIEGLLTGYLGDVQTGEIILDLAKEIKTANPKALWCCDPVLGDTGPGVYVRPEIQGFMKDELLQGIADITTPNQFELELLSGKKLTSREDAVATARKLFCSHGCRTVFVTSLRTPDVPENEIDTLAVTKYEAWIVKTPFIKMAGEQEGTTGTVTAVAGQGDVFTSVAFGTLLRANNLKEALEHAVSTLYMLVKLTPKGSLDLPLIEAQKEITAPSIHFEAEKINI